MINSSLKLWFVNIHSPELVKTNFSYSKPEEFNSTTIRGKNSNNNFSWNKGVKALSVFLINSQIENKKDYLAVNKSNNPSSLNHLLKAIKHENKSFERIFGSDINGNLTINNLIKFSKPSLTNNFITSGCLKTNKLPIKNIEIFIDNKQEKDFKNLKKLSFNIEKYFKYSDTQYKSNYFCNENKFQYNEEKNISNAFSFEIKNSLKRSNIFYETDFSKEITNFKKSKIYKSNQDLSDLIIKNLTTINKKANKFGIQSNKLNNNEINITIPATQITAISLFKYLNSKKNKFNINYNYSCNYEVNQIFSQNRLNNIDILCTSFLNFLYLKKEFNIPYTAKIFLPKISHNIVSSYNNDKTSSGKYILNKHPFSNHFAFYNDLKDNYCLKQEIISSKEYKYHNLIKDRKKDLKVILPAPIGQINKLSPFLCNHKVKEIYSISDICVLSINDKSTSFSGFNSFENLLRDTWLTMYESSLELEKLIDIILKDKRYIKFITRLCHFPT